MEFIQDNCPEVLHPRKMKRNGRARLVAGDSISIKIKGIERLSAQVPAGKQWIVRLLLEATEYDSSVIVSDPNAESESPSV